ncbi:2TM domain-containing protein [Pedococcus bigeumensis]|uniref:2TM domain-containing protein n=1 Tax=Pedococcus bigeumensis TaxID=433644 RepID=UPI002FEA5971
MTEDPLSTRAAEGAGDEQDLRQRAVRRLEAKRGLMGHALAYVMVNLLLIAIWWTTSRGFFWPVFPLFGWGIGLAFHAWDVLSPAPGPRQIEAEMERLRRRP